MTIISLTILSCIISLILYIRYKPSPPELEVVFSDHAIEINPATYSLKKWGREAAEETSTEPAVLVRESTPIMIEESDHIQFLFEHPPVSVKYYLWEIDTGKLAYKGLKGDPVNLEDSNVTSGDYAMEILAKWENGYVLYNTRVIIYDEFE